MPTGAQLFAQTLAHLKIDRVFTLVGDHLNDALAEIATAGIEVIHMRHESGVTHAADAYARIRRKPAVALVTGGPGHTNGLTGIATAQLACSPLIAISGSRSRAVADKQAFQDIDQIGMTRPVVKWAAEPPSAQQIPFYVARAYREAAGGRQGAVHLTIPIDVFEQEGTAAMPPMVPVDSLAANRSDAARAITMLREAQQPMVIAGSGVWWADAGSELRQFIEHTQLPLFTITMARGVVEDDHALCFGYADPALNRAARTALKEADVVLILGKRLDYRLAFGGPRVLRAETRLIQVDVHGPELGMNRRLDLAIQADVKKTLQSLLVEAGAVAWPRLPWIDRLIELRREWQAALVAGVDWDGTPMHPAAFYRQVLRELPPDQLLSWDGGDFAHWGRAMTPARQAGGWLRLGPLGTIGSALPNAIALSLAHPGRKIVMFTGDGSLGFYIAELDTAVRYNLPILIVVGNDAGWGLERELQNAQGTLDPSGGTVACELRATRYDVVMQGFGGQGETVTAPNQVAEAMRRGLAATGPYLINAQIRGVRSPFTEWQIEGKQRAKS